MVFCYRVRVNGKENTYKIGRYPDITIVQARELAKQAAGEVAKGVDVQKAKKAAKHLHHMVSHMYGVPVKPKGDQRDDQKITHKGSK